MFCPFVVQLPHSLLTHSMLAPDLNGITTVTSCSPALSSLIPYFTFARSRLACLTAETSFTFWSIPKEVCGKLPSTVISSFPALYTVPLSPVTLIVPVSASLTVYPNVNLLDSVDEASRSGQSTPLTVSVLVDLNDAYWLSFIVTGTT